jgi:PAS domain-containing protein
MSVKSSRSGLLHNATALLAGSNSPAALLAGILTQSNYPAIVGKLVSLLHDPRYSFTDFLRDAAATKKKLVDTDVATDELVSGLFRVDRAVEDCLARTLIAHEKFIDNTLHAFCEFDQSGVITFANVKMLEWAPGCTGKELAAFFGKMAPDVRKTLSSRGRRRLHQLELVGSGKHYSVLAEFGSVKARGPTSGYALLVDMSELVEAEHKALEAAPYGMLKLDSKYRVVYANRQALEYTQRAAEDVVGRDPVDFITDPESRREVLRQRSERSSGRGGQYSILLDRAKGDAPLHLSVTGVPSFNTAGEFNGTLTALQPIDHEIARREIAQLVATKTDHRALFEGIVEIVGRFVSFDWADLSLYTRKGDYALSFCRVPETGRDYPTRWWPIAPYFQNWIKEPHPLMSDMLADIKKRPDARKALTADGEELISSDGRKALVALPIRRENRIIGALSLTSKEVGKYNEDTLDLLKELGIDQAMLTVFNLREHDERYFVSQLLKKISATTDHQQLAETIVGELARFYKFRNVSIFKINALRGYFSLLAQRLDDDGGSPIPPDYTQELDEGLLGLTLERGETVNLKDRGDGSVEAGKFKQVAPETVAELCIPIRLRGRILWILNLEDTHKNAFAEPEIETIEGIVKQVDTIVEHLFQGLVLTQVLDVFPDGVVIASNKGNVLLCNDAARRLFERSNISLRTELASCLPAADLKRALSEQTSLPWATEIRGVKGKRTRVLMSKFILPVEYDHVVLRLQDVTELEWKTDIERLEAALAEAASLVRVPLSLVSSHVRQMKKANESERADLADKALRQLGRVELTYDRIFASYGSNELPHEQKVPIDLDQIIDHILSELPVSDRAAVKLTACEEPVRVLATSYRLLFALESMLAYLLRARANANEITVEVRKPNEKSVEIVMAGSIQSVEPNGDLERLVEATRNEIALGERLLGQIARECGGVFKRLRRPDGQEQLSMVLKLVRH